MPNSVSRILTSRQSLILRLLDGGLGVAFGKEIRDEREPARLQAEKVWPFYVVYDVSYSMWNPDAFGDYTPWHVMRDSLADLIYEINYSPAARDICHLGVFAFSEDVKTVLPLTPLRNNGLTIPVLPQGRETNYAKIFKALAQTIQNDYARLSKGSRVKRPTVYFVTDGEAQTGGKLQPESVWGPELQRLHGLDSRPVIVALGLGDARETALRTIRSAPGPACVAEIGALPGQLLKAIVNSIIFSVVNSAGRDEFVFDLPPGMRRVD